MFPSVYISVSTRSRIVHRMQKYDRFQHGHAAVHDEHKHGLRSNACFQVVPPLRVGLSCDGEDVPIIERRKFYFVACLSSS